MDDSLTVSTVKTSLNLIKAFMGTGLLTVPFAVSCTGIWLGGILVGILTILSNHTLKMLVTMSRVVQKSAESNANTPTIAPRRTDKSVTYEDIGESAFGKAGRNLAVWAMLVTNIGTVIGYMVFVGNMSLHLAEVIGVAEGIPENVTDSKFDIPLMPQEKNSVKINLLLFGLIPLLGGLSLLKSMKKLAFVSIFGTIAIMGTIVVVMYFSLSHMAVHGQAEVHAFNFGSLPTFFGIAIFSFSIHGVILSIVGPMKYPDKAHKMMDGCAAIVGGIYCGFGMIGYLAFGADIKPSILDNIPQDTVVGRSIKILTYVLMISCISLSIPLFNFPIFRVVEGFIWGEEATTSINGSPEVQKVGSRASSTSTDIAYSLLDASAEEGQNIQTGKSIGAPSGGRKDTKIALLRLLIVSLMVFASFLLGAIFADVIAFVGAFSMSTLAFILPSLFYIKIMWSRVGMCEKITAVFIFVFGICAMIISSYVAVKRIVYDSSHGSGGSCAA